MQAARRVSNLTGVQTITCIVLTLVGHDSGVCGGNFAIGVDRAFVEFDLDIMGFQMTELNQTLDRDRLIDVNIFWCGDIDAVDFEMLPMLEHLLFPVGEILTSLITIVGDNVVAIASWEVASICVVAEHPSGIEGRTIEANRIFHLRYPFTG